MCAAPAVPTATTIATEGLKRARITNPTASQIADAETWLEDVKNDLFRKEKRLNSLYVPSVLVLDIGKWRYSMPVDYASDLSMVLVSGSVTGTATAGSTSSITLPSGTTVTTGQEILITSGSGEGSLSQVTSFASQVAGVEPNFNTAPDATSVFMVIDTYRDLDRLAIRRLDKYSSPTTKGIPLEYFETGDNDNGEIIVRPVPDGTYGLKYRYYQDMMEIDLTSTLMSTLYKKWRRLFTQYVKYVQFDRARDSSTGEAKREYEMLLLETIMDETSGIGEDEIKIEPRFN